MRATLTLLLALCSGSFAVAADVCSIPTNLVTNCGFETGSFTGWSISGTDSASGNGIFYGVENFNQYSGNDAAYFGAVGGEITLSQSLTNLIADDVYTITLEAFNDTTPTGVYVNNLTISMANATTQVASQLSADGYTLYTIKASPLTTSSTLAITSRNDVGFWNIDSIDVIQTGTPEPAPFVLCGIGMAFLVALRFLARRMQLRA